MASAKIPPLHGGGWSIWVSPVTVLMYLGGCERFNWKQSVETIPLGPIIIGFHFPDIWSVTVERPTYLSLLKECQSLLLMSKESMSLEQP